MSWFRLEGRMPSHPKFAPLSDAAFRLWVTAGVWCAEHLTNGAIPKGVPATLPKAPQGRRLQTAISELINARLFERVGDDFAIHDYLDWNPDATTARQRQKERAEQCRRAGKAGAERRWRGGAKGDSGADHLRKPDANRDAIAFNGTDDRQPTTEDTSLCVVSGSQANRAASKRTHFSDVPSEFEKPFLQVVETFSIHTGRLRESPKDLWSAFREFVRERGLTTADLEASTAKWLRNRLKFERLDAERVRAPTPKTRIVQPAHGNSAARWEAQAESAASTTPEVTS